DLQGQAAGVGLGVHGGERVAHVGARVDAGRRVVDAAGLARHVGHARRGRVGLRGGRGVEVGDITGVGGDVVARERGADRVEPTLDGRLRPREPDAARLAGREVDDVRVAGEVDGARERAVVLAEAGGDVERAVLDLGAGVEQVDGDRRRG